MTERPRRGRLWTGPWSEQRPRQAHRGERERALEAVCSAPERGAECPATLPARPKTTGRAHVLRDPEPESHPSGTIHFFTPRLYQQFNSPDPAEEERAYEAWERAILAYKQQLDSVRDRMPPQVVALSGSCLHDAEVVKREGIVQVTGPHCSHEFPFPPWTALAVITVRLEGEILCLFYSLWDRVRVCEAPDDWQFSKLREHWLYDEVRVQGDRGVGTNVHSILLSTGVVLDVPFTSVVVHRVPVPQPVTAAERKTA